MVKLLFVGDVVGRPGRRVLRDLLPGLIDRHAIDYTVVNVENAAGGFGITPAVLAELDELPIDCMTTGNHAWAKREGLPLFEQRSDLLRPANYPSENPGRGLHVGETAAGVRVATINLEGQVFMSPLPSPWQCADRLLASLDRDVRVILVDFHAEATSEKQAMGFYLDGRVSAVVGTHTHVPTADARILPAGTGFQTDVGMTGPYEGVIGSRSEKALRRFLVQTPSPLEVAKRDPRVAAVVLSVDEQRGHCEAIEPLLVEGRY